MGLPPRAAGVGTQGSRREECAVASAHNLTSEQRHRDADRTGDERPGEPSGRCAAAQQGLRPPAPPCLFSVATAARLPCPLSSRTASSCCVARRSSPHLLLSRHRHPGHATAPTICLAVGLFRSCPPQSAPVGVSAAPALSIAVLRWSCEVFVRTGAISFRPSVRC